MYMYSLCYTVCVCTIKVFNVSQWGEFIVCKSCLDLKTGVDFKTQLQCYGEKHYLRVNVHVHVHLHVHVHVTCTAHLLCHGKSWNESVSSFIGFTWQWFCGEGLKSTVTRLHVHLSTGQHDRSPHKASPQHLTHHPTLTLRMCVRVSAFVCVCSRG